MAFYIRLQAIEFGKKSYVFGCEDAAYKMEVVGKTAESELLKKFCKARNEALDNYLGIM